MEPWLLLSVTQGFGVAFNVGARDLGIALYGDVQTSSGPQSERLVDTSMQLALANSTAAKIWANGLVITVAVGLFLIARAAGQGGQLVQVVMDAMQA